MSHKPLVSVCMITYNHERFIDKAIEGVLNQECTFDIELIIADDASTDRTEEIVQSFHGSSRFHIVKYTKHRENIGMMGNFSWALKQAKGRFIALCDGDDFWTDSFKLEKQTAFMVRNPEVSICSHVVNVQLEEINDKDSKNRFSRPNSEFIGRLLRQKDIIDMITNRGPLFHTSSYVFRKSALSLPKSILQYQVGDYPLLFSLLQKGFAYVMPFEGSVYRIHNNGISSTYISDTILKNKNIILFANLIKSDFGVVDSRISAKVVKAYAHLCRIYFREKNYNSFFKIYFKYVRLCTRCALSLIFNKVLSKDALHS